MMDKRTKAPDHVLARQRAERRIWIALDGLSNEQSLRILDAARETIHERLRAERPNVGMLLPTSPATVFRPASGEQPVGHSLREV